MAALAAEPPDPAAQAAQFVSAFSARYGDVHPAWVASSWRDAAAAAHRQFKFLLVYLHAPEHEDTDAYVRSVLCDAHVASYADAHFVAWGGSIRQPDAFTLSGRLNVSAYPCVALLAFSGSRTKLVAAAQGSMSARALLAMLTRVQDEQSVMLTAERLEQEERVR
jgi:FAS-associated factor 2